MWGGGGGIGDFRKKISYRLNSRRKNSCKEIYLAKKKFLHWKKYIFNGERCWGKKSYMSGKKILSPDYSCNSITQSKSPIPPQPLPQKSNGRPLKHFYVVVDRAVTAEKCTKAWCTRRVIVLPIEAPWKRTQHYWPTTPNTFENFCVRLHAKILTGFKPSATTSQNMQQSVEKNAAFNIGNC